MGPALGGALAQPVRNYPSWFSTGSVFDTYPFLLPNLVCVAIISCGLAIGILFLQETHAEHKRCDPGIRLGDWLIRKLTQSSNVRSYDEKDEAYRHPEMEKLVQKEKADSYTTPKSKSICSNMSATGLSKFRSIGAQKAFTRTVTMNIVAFGIMA